MHREGGQGATRRMFLPITSRLINCSITISITSTKEGDLFTNSCGITTSMAPDLGLCVTIVIWLVLLDHSQ